MKQSEKFFTSGNWYVKKRKEEEFRIEWKKFADWSTKNLKTGTPYLLEDVKNPLHFISFGSWPDLDTIARWRATPEFSAFVAKVKVLCETFEPSTLKVVGQ